ncbi:hypothetical protein B0H13DRAFT_760519 [Mycena leptocephala]|nr:hypothetical protein B0H13DRAFT_760519 [Mycena leptocephala]
MHSESGFRRPAPGCLNLKSPASSPCEGRRALTLPMATLHACLAGRTPLLHQLRPACLAVARLGRDVSICIVLPRNSCLRLRPRRPPTVSSVVATSSQSLTLHMALARRHHRSHHPRPRPVVPCRAMLAQGTRWPIAIPSLSFVSVLRLGGRPVRSCDRSLYPRRFSLHTRRPSSPAARAKLWKRRASAYTFTGMRYEPTMDSKLEGPAHSRAPFSSPLRTPAPSLHRGVCGHPPRCPRIARPFFVSTRHCLRRWRASLRVRRLSVSPLRAPSFA